MSRPRWSEGWSLQVSRLVLSPAPVSPFPLIEPDGRIYRIRLSDGIR